MHTSDTLQRESTVTRRRFVAFVGWGSFAAFWGSIVLAILRFLFPRILYEPSPLFQAGKLDDYQIGEVSTRFKEAHGCGSSAPPTASMRSLPFVPIWGVPPSGTPRRSAS